MPKPSKKELKALNDIANKSTIKVWRTRNMIMLEAVIAAFMDTDSPEEVATILRAQADMLLDFG
ncbi:hypothetical protein [Stenotrophomonas maltophilia group sp. RNC7]|uniref:hypothetical protein n=1 Tax=Stenotrophomonas maltophilia group sp. RNC7 TaxID=3071467 RepID=UPI0027E0F153|nr:hypothetical protein [Stenotrophomonas maltophilia group sp. RNC7]MDQ4681874.1 hypothetical protein [Stenotrophomonas maltophilia group sp. RNC7]